MPCCFANGGGSLSSSHRNSSILCNPDTNLAKALSNRRRKNMPIGDSNTKQARVQATVKTQDSFAFDDVNDRLVGRLK